MHKLRGRARKLRTRTRHIAEYVPVLTPSWRVKFAEDAAVLQSRGRPFLGIASDQARVQIASQSTEPV